ncbi:Exodeoxyribonuclease I subunit D [Hathewaya proteolytica DSM 3090]|uniref:Nuclease SbcCD subunit D n=1 Tax=Hathewaya proteolytica DSM 3090 TaxID=1121331 RepID=A0A1M6MT95_9CLOT|nr:exonuclease SbcCD subunit D [Hathewaya proteolytica]SHJ86626.1 Exodeoxyribonuclease I subunit D [Hathewaya proteolytica DSM 3090]
MRILHTSDFHLGKNLEGFSRMDEQQEFLEDFSQLVIDKKIDLVIIAGDIYDSSNPPARAENMFYELLKKISNDGKTMTLVISGNHDNPQRLVAAAPLAMEHGIVMVATPKTVIPPGKYGMNEICDSGEGYIEAYINGEKIVILTVPYPSEKRLDEVLYDIEESDEEKAMCYSHRLKGLFDNLSQHYKDDTINIATSHLFAMGSEETGSERSIQLGGSFIVNCDCFPKKAQYVALGHIHKPMSVPGTMGKVRYAGSPLQYNKNEINFTKGCYILDIHCGEEPDIETVNFKTYKPIEIWKCSSVNDAIDKCRENGNKNCWVYLEIETDSFISQEHIKEMKSYKDDILEIRPIIKSEDQEDNEDQCFNLSEKSFKELFSQFYIKNRKVEPEDEVIQEALAIMEEEEI